MRLCFQRRICLYKAQSINNEKYNIVMKNLSLCEKCDIEMKNLSLCERRDKSMDNKEGAIFKLVKSVILR